MLSSSSSTKLQFFFPTNHYLPRGENLKLVLQLLLTDNFLYSHYLPA